MSEKTGDTPHCPEDAHSVGSLGTYLGSGARHLCCPVFLTLFKDPVVASDGRTSALQMLESRKSIVDLLCCPENCTLRPFG